MTLTRHVPAPGREVAGRRPELAPLISRDEAQIACKQRTLVRHPIQMPRGCTGHSGERDENRGLHALAG